MSTQLLATVRISRSGSSLTKIYNLHYVHDNDIATLMRQNVASVTSIPLQAQTQRAKVHHPAMSEAPAARACYKILLVAVDDPPKDVIGYFEFAFIPTISAHVNSIKRTYVTASVY